MREPVAIEDLDSLFGSKSKDSLKKSRLQRQGRQRKQRDDTVKRTPSNTSSESLVTPSVSEDSIKSSLNSTNLSKKRGTTGPKACAACARSHLSCDGNRPCGRCQGKKLVCEERLSKAELRKKQRTTLWEKNGKSLTGMLPKLVPVGWMPWMASSQESSLLPIHPFVLSTLSDTSLTSSSNGSASSVSQETCSSLPQIPTTAPFSNSSQIQQQQPYPPLPNHPSNLIYPSEKILHCSSSSQNPKCRSCKANIVQVSKTCFSPFAQVNQKISSEHTQEEEPWDLEQLIRETMSLPDCFSFLDSILLNEVSRSLPLWMSQVSLSVEMKTRLLEYESRISLSLSVNPRSTLRQESTRLGLPTQEASIQEYSRAFLMMNSPAALWSVPDGFLRLSNASFTALSSKDLIQLCIHPNSLEDLYKLMETCVSSGSATGQLMLLKSVRAALSISLVWTTQGPLMVGYFIPL